MKYLLKQTILPFIYLGCMALTAWGVWTMEEDQFALKVILLVLNLALYAVIVCFMAFKDGEMALKTRNANDAERRIIIETGAYRELKVAEEYAPWKGFAVGLIVCAPLIICVIIDVILKLSGTSNDIFQIIPTFLYLMVQAIVQLLGGNYFYILLSIPFICCCTGIPFILGAKKIERQQEMIRQKHAKIYGEDK